MSGKVLHLPSARSPLAKDLRRQREKTPKAADALQLGAKLARLRVEHPDAGALIEQLIDDALTDWAGLDDPKGGAV